MATVKELMDAGDSGDTVYVRRDTLSDARRHGTVEHVPVVVEKVWTQGVARVHSPRTLRTYLVDVDDVTLELASSTQ